MTTALAQRSTADSNSIEHEQHAAPAHVSDREDDRAMPTLTVDESVISADTIWRSIRVVLMVVAMALVGGLAVAFIVLGSNPLIPGFVVAFLMIMFIGMPLILASIGDALESAKGEPH